MKHSISHFGNLGNTHLFELGKICVWVHTGKLFRILVQTPKHDFRIA